MKHTCLLFILICGFVCWCCTSPFSITDYSLAKCQVIAGEWEDDELVADPSISILVTGPKVCEWEVTVVSDDNQFFSFPVVTGEERVYQLKGLGLSGEHRETGLFVQVDHMDGGETLATKNGLVASIVGEFFEDLPSSTELFSVFRIILTSDGEAREVSFTKNRSEVSSEKVVSEKLVLPSGHNFSISLHYTTADKTSFYRICTSDDNLFSNASVLVALPGAESSDNPNNYNKSWIIRNPPGLEDGLALSFITRHNGTGAIRLHLHGTEDIGTNIDVEMPFAVTGGAEVPGTSIESLELLINDESRSLHLENYLYTGEAFVNAPKGPLFSPIRIPNGQNFKLKLKTTNDVIIPYCRASTGRAYASEEEALQDMSMPDVLPYAVFDEDGKITSASSSAKVPWEDGFSVFDFWTVSVGEGFIELIVEAEDRLDRIIMSVPYTVCEPENDGQGDEEGDGEHGNEGDNSQEGQGETISVRGFSYCVDNKTVYVEESEDGTYPVVVPPDTRFTLYPSISPVNAEVECSVSIDQDLSGITMNDDPTRKEDLFIINLTSGKTGSAFVTLTLKAGNTVKLSVPVSVREPEQKQALNFTPPALSFPGFPARGSVRIDGFNKDKKYDIVMSHQSFDYHNPTADVTAKYESIEVGKETTVTLWNGDGSEPRTGGTYNYEFEVYEHGQNDVLYSSKNNRVRMLSTPGLSFIDEDGTTRTNHIRSKTHNARFIANLPISDKQKNVATHIVTDITTGTNLSPDPEGNTSQWQSTITRPKRGPHSFVFSLSSTDGQQFEWTFEKTFFDCWTLEPFVKSNSLYVNVRGPESLPVKCDMRLIADMYGMFSYTVAEMVDGQKVNTEKKEYVYAEGRYMDFTLNAGTGDETVAIQKGWVNTGFKHLKSTCEKVDFPSNLEASRWNSKGAKEKYTPKSTAYARVLILIRNSEFSESFLELEFDSSQFLTYLKEKGIEASLYQY